MFLPTVVFSAHLLYLATQDISAVDSGPDPESLSCQICYNGTLDVRLNSHADYMANDTVCADLSFSVVGQNSAAGVRGAAGVSVLAGEEYGKMAELPRCEICHHRGPMYYPNAIALKDDSERYCGKLTFEKL